MTPSCECCGFCLLDNNQNHWSVELRSHDTDLRAQVTLCDKCHDAADLIWHTQFRQWKAHLLKLLQSEAK